MKVSLDWLKDYVDIKTSPEVLAQKLTMAGLEVTSLEEKETSTVFEIEVTSNRPDCLSVLGIAQEVAAILDSKSKIKKSQQKYKIRKSKTLSLKSNFIKIQDKEDCSFYRGCLIADVKVGPSPKWLRDRIESLGIHPVNNIVDITNYCLLEYGQPLHAFDYDKIVEQIVVRRARKAEKILTIDGTERQLSENILVISDKNKAIAIAGIMGDKLSEVGPVTKNILLESACFNPVLTRRASRELGLSSESSYRFERQVAFERIRGAQDRAVELICEIADGKIVDAKEAGLKSKPKEEQIKFDCKRANNLLSLNISVDRVKRIFTSLGFSCRKTAKDMLLVKIPQLRSDIRIEEDLVEELARIYGYNNIPSTLPAIRSSSIENSTQEAIKPSIREILCALGFSETINYSLLSKDVIEATGIDKDVIRLNNPLSSEQEYLRPMLVTNLLNCLTYNLNHKNMNLKFFEIGHVFDADSCESISLGLIATGKSIDNWQLKKEFDFFSLKGSVQNLICRLGFEDFKILLSEGNNMFSQGQTAKIICQKREVGVLGKIDNRILFNFGIKNLPSVFYAEIFLQELCKCARKKSRFQALSIFPSIIRDMSLIAKSSIQYEDIVDAIREETGEYLKNIQLIDTYKGQQISAGCAGLTISLEFGLFDRTLTDEEVVKIQQRITKRLKVDLEIEIR